MRATWALVLGWWAIPGAWAQDAAPEASPAEGASAPPASSPGGGIRASLDITVMHAPAASFSSVAGEVATTKAGAALNVLMPAGERGRVGLNFSSIEGVYSFDPLSTGASGLGFEPWDRTLTHRVGARYMRAEPDGSTWFAGGYVESSGEIGADFDDTLTFGLLGGMTWRVSERFSMGVGAGVGTRLERDPLPIPVVVLDWELAEGWRLSSMGGSPGLELSYSPDEQWRFWLRGSYESDAYRLDDTNSVASAAGGVGRVYAVPVLVGADWNLGQQFSLRAGVGAMVWQELGVLDSGGGVVFEQQTDPTIVGEFSLVWRF